MDEYLDFAPTQVGRQGDRLFEPGFRWRALVHPAVYGAIAMPAWCGVFTAQRIDRLMTTLPKAALWLSHRTVRERIEDLLGREPVYLTLVGLVASTVPEGAPSALREPIPRMVRDTVEKGRALQGDRGTSWSGGSALCSQDLCRSECWRSPWRCRALLRSKPR